MFIHELHDACPACTHMFRPIAIKDVISTPMRHLNLHQSRTSDGLLEIVEAMLGVLYLKSQVSRAVIVGGAVEGWLEGAVV